MYMFAIPNASELISRAICAELVVQRPIAR
jgi:hypothetical protein